MPPGNSRIARRGTASWVPGASPGKTGLVFAGRASSVASLIPFTIPISANSQSGPWAITTGTNAAVMASAASASDVIDPCRRTG